jgi:hypothetical protein
MDVLEAYRRRIGAISGCIGIYQSCQDTPIHQLKYWMRTAHESHPHPYQIRIRYGVRNVLEESGNIAI